MDTEIDSALTVLLFGLGERSKAARDERAHVSVVIQRDTVELVRHKGECDIVAPVEAAQDLEKSSPKPCVSGRVCRKGRRKVRPGKIAGRRTQRHERGIANGRRV